eukprot:5738702-Ditylum_brightwellii.AAC.3
MKRAESCGGIVSEQYGSRRGKAADVHALNTRLFYDLLLLERKPATSIFIDLDMVHTCHTAFGDSTSSYGGDLWTVQCQLPPQGLGQGNKAAPYLWALVNNPILNALCDKDNSTIVQLDPTPDTSTEALVQMAQEEIDLYAGLARATDGQASGSSATIMQIYMWKQTSEGKRWNSFTTP